MTYSSGSVTARARIVNGCNRCAIDGAAMPCESGTQYQFLIRMSRVVAYKAPNLPKFPTYCGATTCGDGNGRVGSTPRRAGNLGKIFVSATRLAASTCGTIREIVDNICWPWSASCYNDRREAKGSMLNSETYPGENAFQKAPQSASKRLTHPVFRGKSRPAERRCGRKQAKMRRKQRESVAKPAKEEPLRGWSRLIAQSAKLSSLRTARRSVPATLADGTMADNPI